MRFASAEHRVRRHGPATGAPHRRGKAVKVEKHMFATVWVRFRFVLRPFGSVFGSFFVRLGRVRFVFRSLGSVFGSFFVRLGPCSVRLGSAWSGSVRFG